MVSLDPYPDPDSQSGSGSRRAIIIVPTKIGKKLIKFIIEVRTQCSLLRAEGFSCILDVLLW